MGSRPCRFLSEASARTHVHPECHYSEACSQLAMSAGVWSGDRCWGRLDYMLQIQAAQ